MAYYIILSFSKFYIWGAAYVHGKFEGRVQKVSPTLIQPPPSPASPPDGTLVTTDEPALTGQCHPESTADIRVTLGAVYPADLDKWAMMCPSS